VGYDSHTSVPPVERGAILIDFNARLKLPAMSPLFPLEFAHVWVPSHLAFWRTDLLVDPKMMRKLADRFANLPDNWMAAVTPMLGLLGGLRAWLKRELRYCELIGCTTRTASQNCWDKGCGWWSGWPWHPSNSAEEHKHRKKFCCDNGAGIHYWHKFCAGNIDLIPERDVAEGQFSGIGGPNSNLADACRKLGIVRPSPSRHRGRLR
jgi:hypothetical protein